MTVLPAQAAAVLGGVEALLLQPALDALLARCQQMWPRLFPVRKGAAPGTLLPGVSLLEAGTVMVMPFNA